MDDTPQATYQPYQPGGVMTDGGAVFTNAPRTHPREAPLPPLLTLAQRMQLGAERAHAMCDALEQVLVQLSGPRPTPAPDREEDSSPGALPVLVATQDRVESAHNRLEALVGELRGTLGA